MDLISRQEAINVLEERIRANGYSNVALVSELHRSIEYLMRLPSVQTEKMQLSKEDATKDATFDCISRQAAIDAVNGLPDCPNGFSETYDKATIIGILEDVPSAQPEHTETHSCDCEHTETHDLVSRRAALEAMDTWDKFGCDPDGKLVRYDDDKHYVPYVHYEDMVHAVKNLPPAQPRWISVTERLPEEKQDVLLAFKHNMVVGFWEDILNDGGQAWYANSGNGWFTGTEAVDDDGFPLAWMPLPEAYKGEQDVNH